jgi:hypothetical protein
MLYVLGEETFDNGYQPKTINGKTLKKTGMTIGQTGLKGSTSWNGKNMDSQNIWTDGTNQWIWVRTGEGKGHYVSYDMLHKGAVDFSNTKSISYLNYEKNSRNFKTSSPNTSAIEANKKKNTQTQTQPQTQTQTQTTKPSTNTGSKGGTVSTSAVDQSIYDLINELRAENKEYKTKIEELSKPKYYTAGELAEMHGVQDLYNEQKWLDDYNAATNKYYDEAVATQQDLRNSYAVNNGQYLDKTLDSYMESYANQAPTATAKGATAANALSTMLGAGQTYSNDDYNMLQTQNLLEEQRKAELANNPNVARQQYNNIALMLSTLGTDYHSSAVKEYVNKLDAYGNMYANNRAAEGLVNEGTAAKYNGLLSASKTNALSKASTSDWSQLYNYFYKTRNEDSYATDSAIAKLLNSSMNRAQ